MLAEAAAKKSGYNKVSELKLAVSLKIRDFVAGVGICLQCARPQKALVLPWQQRWPIFCMKYLIATRLTRRLS